jgi:hypothetical protein
MTRLYLICILIAGVGFLCRFSYAASAAELSKYMALAQKYSN